VRPPKDKWNYTARAVRAQQRALEELAGLLASLVPLPLKVQHRLRQARGAANRLRRHVLESEECEQD
jgi:hypothetical protein